MIELPNVTLICVDCVNQGLAISAIRKSLQHIKPEMVVFITDIEYEAEDFEVVVIDPIRSVDEYSRFMIKELINYFNTDFVMVIQADGYVIDGDAWDESFLDYDYIGSPWLYPTRNVGNGAVSIRSNRLQEILSKDKFIDIVAPEDEIIGRLYRNYLETKRNIEFAPEEIAHKFSFELHEPFQKTFAFHSYFHQPFKEHVVVKRTGANGDVVMAEPILQYYHDQGYQVVLDTLPEIMHIFYNHPFKIKHLSEMNPKVKPIKVINLDMSYESKPKQRVLETYYEFAGIKDGIIRNSKLYVNATHEQRLFKKFIVFHIDKTGMTHRDANGVNWGFVGFHFTRLGYTCIQVGKGDHEAVGTYFYTETKELLMYLLKGADAVCAIDSGIAQLSVALGIPTAIMTGSVNLELRYVDFTNIQAIRTECPTRPDRFCYHEIESSTVGKKCDINENRPPCCVYNEWDVIRSLNKLLKLN